MSVCGQRALTFAFTALFSLNAGIAAADEPSVFASALPLSAASTGSDADALRLAEERHSFLKGWDYLYDLLADEGIEPGTLVRVFSDSRMPANEALLFSVSPRESRALYSRMNTVRNRRHALSFYRENTDSFRAAEERFNVPASIVLALIQIETSCGENTGSFRIFPRLARLAAAAEPGNVRENYLKNQGPLRLISYERFATRANVLQDTFLPHAAAALRLASQQNKSVFDLYGSSAGAMGMPQFLPGNIAQFGIDADNSGAVDIFSPADSIFSVANFLRAFGWEGERSLTPAEKREVIRNYNRSEPYVSTALAMADAFDRVISPPPVRALKKAAPASKINAIRSQAVQNRKK